MKLLSDGQLFIKYLSPFNGYVESYSISLATSKTIQAGWSFCEFHKPMVPLIPFALRAVDDSNA